MYCIHPAIRSIQCPNPARLQSGKVRMFEVAKLNCGIFNLLCATIYLKAHVVEASEEYLFELLFSTRG
jgi:hypothetical protein